MTTNEPKIRTDWQTCKHIASLSSLVWATTTLSRVSIFVSAIVCVFPFVLVLSVLSSSHLHLFQFLPLPVFSFISFHLSQALSECGPLLALRYLKTDPLCVHPSTYLRLSAGVWQVPQPQHNRQEAGSQGQLSLWGVHVCPLYLHHQATATNEAPAAGEEVSCDDLTPSLVHFYSAHHCLTSLIKHIVMHVKHHLLCSALGWKHWMLLASLHCGLYALRR